jgi:fibro-slime domain-containing protein
MSLSLSKRDSLLLLVLLVATALGGAPGCGGGGSGGDGGAGDTVATPTCGQPGTQCCAGNACGGGGCCVSGICMAQGSACVNLGGICSAGSCGNCGGPGQACCGADPSTGACTSAGTVCTAGTCTTCGDLGTQCCAGVGGGTGTCNGANAVCNGSNVCILCGAPGGACCPGSKCDGRGCCYDGFCSAEGSACGAGGGTCQAGRCSACGSATQPCCANLCYDGLLCKSGTCTACGGLGQACCETGTGAGTCQTGMTCAPSGVCSRCGGLGENCCAGSTCSEGCCSAGVCLAPGTGACPIKTPDGGVQGDGPIVGGGGTGGQVDAPLGGGGGAGGAVVAGAGGAGGTGGVVARTGGVTGTAVQTGGTSGTTVSTGGIQASTGGAGGGSTPPWTPPAGCGDGVVVAPERCDDGNTLPFDGCSSDCQNEPICNGPGPCTSRCGDGLVVGEECDDGNTANGDGCSSSCKVEAGFTCAQPALTEPLLLPAVYRDFRAHKPSDFEPGITGQTKATTGMVLADLDSEGKPVFAGGPADGGVQIGSKESFASWYRSSSVNHASASKLALWKSANGAFSNRWGASGEKWTLTEFAYYCGNVGEERLDANGEPIPCTLKYSSSTDCDKLLAKGLTMLTCAASGRTYSAYFLLDQMDGTPVFFPVDGDTFTPESELKTAMIPPPYDSSEMWPRETDSAGKSPLHNFSFTSEIRYWFRYDPDRAFKVDITGDDDVWVFINKKLAVDLGGIHTPVAGSVKLDGAAAAKFGLVAGNVYEVAVFQAERQTDSSTFKITLDGFNTAPSQCRPN